MGLSTEDYIRSYARTTNIDYEGYLEFTSECDGYTKSEAHSDWKVTIDRLRQSKSKGLLQRGKGLQRKWDKNAHRFLDDLHWAVQERKWKAKLQLVPITELADASVNKKMRLMLQKEVNAAVYTSPGSANTGLRARESSGELDGVSEEPVGNDIEGYSDDSDGGIEGNTQPFSPAIIFPDEIVNKKKHEPVGSAPLRSPTSSLSQDEKDRAMACSLYPRPRCIGSPSPLPTNLFPPVGSSKLPRPVYSSQYFVFRGELPQDLHERKTFVGFSWVFIRGALTMTKIETRSLEVLITGVEERKNQDKDLRFETKQTGHKAHGEMYEMNHANRFRELITGV
ncbi:hypothetical protein BGZ49_009950 [Haplosporangium sp. Z 27]|nr:hypothetical protein BGZ49_009950 [Haplosporangium sp. Z 27]